MISDGWSTIYPSTPIVNYRRMQIIISTDYLIWNVKKQGEFIVKHRRITKQID